MYDGRIWDTVERRKSGGRGDRTVEEDLAVEWRLRRGSGRQLFGPQVRSKEVALVCGEVVVDGETTLSEEHVRRIRSISLYTQQTQGHLTIYRTSPYQYDDCLEDKRENYQNSEQFSGHNPIICTLGWWRSSPSLTGELSLACSGPAADR